MDATISWTCRYISEILARPKHYQSSWMSTLAVPATDKTTNSVSPLRCESPCWLHRCGIILVSASSWLQGARWLMSCGGCTQPLMPLWLERGPPPNHNLQASLKFIHSICNPPMMMAKWSSSHCFSISLSSGIWARMWLLSSVLSECTCFSIPS